MSKKIEVLIDVYRNYFGDDYKTNPYVYDNVRAVNPNDEDIVKECMERIQKDKPNLLLENDMILPMNDLKPKGKDIKGYLNIENDTFEFN